MKKFILLCLTMIAFLVSCDKDPDLQVSLDDVEFDIQIPTPLKTYVGAEVTLKCAQGKGPLKTDKLLFKSGYTSVECRIIEASDTEFTFVVADGITNASYFIWIERGGATKKVGAVNVKIVEPGTPDVDYNLYGTVTAGGVGVPGVVVSDGNLTTVTDQDGNYSFQSPKKRGYVFISIPSGYEVPSDGALPRFYKLIEKNDNKIEKADFTLTPVSGQDNHIMYVLGDMHLAARNDDLKQFHTFANDLNEQITANSALRQYALTLGDMTWEIYWYKFNLSQYVTEINTLFPGIQIFHTIGNHDHDVNYAGDFNTVLEYFSNIGPNYYSFNIGKVHYVVLDNIYCKNTGDGSDDSRDYDESLDSEQLSWLKKDLSHVDKSMTVVVASHAPIYYPSGTTTYTTNVGNYKELMNSLKGFKEVHFFSGHTHDVWNADYLSDAQPHFEHNAGAVCATWWWTYSTCGMNLARDGAPGGYTICEFDGNDVEWLFKGYDRDIKYQFRAYDMNNVDSAQFWDKYANIYSAVNKNSVLLNIWNWDPEWKLSVTEEGKELSWRQIRNYDPLHVLGYYMVRGGFTTSAFHPKNTSHLFLVEASKGNTTLDIKVTDRFGNVFTEKMTRPRPFSVDTYK